MLLVIDHNFSGPRAAQMLADVLYRPTLPAEGGLTKNYV